MWCTFKVFKIELKNKKDISKCVWSNSQDSTWSYERLRNDQIDFWVNETNPLLALQRIISLYDNLQHKEAAKFIKNLHSSTFLKMIPELPNKMLIEALLSSFEILESLYLKFSSIN